MKIPPNVAEPVSADALNRGNATYVPQAASTPSPEEKTFETSGIGRRFFALVIDLIILRVAVGFSTLPFRDKLPPEALDLSILLEPGQTDTLKELLAILLCTFLVTLFIWGFYFTYFHWATGQTLGKKLLGIRVVKRDGSPLCIGESFARWVGFMIGMAVFGLGIIWAVISRDRRGWHDKMAGTTVITGGTN